MKDIATQNTISNTDKDTETRSEKVRVVPTNCIDDFPEHTFKVKEDESMQALLESISMYGVISPVVARQKDDGRYELISGHRRKYACQKLGIETMPVIVRPLNREQAIIAMVDSNLQREHILPSEKAFAYKMKLEALKCQGKRTDLTSVPMAQKSGETSRKIVGKDSGESQDQIRRYIRLTELIPELLELVDEGRIAFRPAVELSYLTETEQRDLIETIDSEETTPSLAQAIRIKKLSQEGILSMDAIFAIMTEEKPNQVEKIKIPFAKLDRYFQRGTPHHIIEETICRALEEYRNRRRIKQNQNRDAR